MIISGMACDSDVAGMDVCSEEVANALQDFKEQMVFVEDAVVSLYTNDPAADEIRPTHDIDVTLNIINLSH